MSALIGGYRISGVLGRRRFESADSKTFLLIPNSSKLDFFSSLSLFLSRYAETTKEFGIRRNNLESEEGLELRKCTKTPNMYLFLDYDVRLHPGTIGALTTEIEKNPEIFIQTGYPLDLPSGTLGSYCIYEYHMVGNASYCISYDLRSSDANHPINIAVRCKVPIQVNKYLAYSDEMSVIESGKLSTPAPASNGLLFIEQDR
ncbi:PREDICTED: uncharacterized protein LOC104758197 [Camelina sativa]|uniref:Uncharacterized protein LOC104758197 n=1 Tax=Camelina sativa TaxID=90675 RepID=A0ABM0X1S0_CAMSA|nr:PREDICTED: uncharacterized protein LOC104758197 [Camelina sativa]